MARETHQADAHAAPTRPKLLVLAPAAACDATAVYSCSPQGPGAELMFTLDDLRGDYVDGVAAQCRGLTLLYDAVAPAYYVVNAATRAVTRLPPCQEVLYSSAGLGFDARAKEYKVMRLLQKPSDPDVSCEVYTLGGKHAWRPLEASCREDPFELLPHCLLCHSECCSEESPASAREWFAPLADRRLVFKNHWSSSSFHHHIFSHRGDLWVGSVTTVQYIRSALGGA